MPDPDPFLLRLARALLDKAERTGNEQGIKLKLDRRQAPELIAENRRDVERAKSEGRDGALRLLDTLRTRLPALRDLAWLDTSGQVRADSLAGSPDRQSLDELLVLSQGRPYFFTNSADNHILQHRVVLNVLREGLVMARAGDLQPVREMAGELAAWFAKHTQSLDAALALHMRREMSERAVAAAHRSSR